MARGEVGSGAKATRRVLYVSYAFPPVGGAGVQRTVKFTKYLPDYGWLPTVLSVKNPSVPVVDHDLLADVRPEVTVLRARTWEPAYAVKRSIAAAGSTKRGRLRELLRRSVTELLQPDAQRLWNASAYRAATRLLQREPHDAVVVTGPPFSSFLIGQRLKQRFRLPLLLDFRDEWMLSKQYLENMRGSEQSNDRHRKLMHAALRSADAVVATTEASARELSRCCSEAGSSASVRCIYNGFDSEDFASLDPDDAGGLPFRIVYTGTLWNLTDVTPLVGAAHRFARKHPSLAKHLQLEMIGRRVPEQDAVLDRLAKMPLQLKRTDYLPHSQALRRASEADALCLLLADRPGAERVVPGKLFEYLALRRPILAFVPPGETHDLLSRYADGLFVAGNDPEAAADWLAHRIGQREDSSRKSDGCQAFRSPRFRRPAGEGDADIDRFSRRCLTGQLAAILDDLKDSAKTERGRAAGQFCRV